jgi:hypothetical protein
VKIREYSGPLTVLITGILGFSLFCIVSAAALSDPRAPNTSALQPQELVDSAISNMNTMAALTVEVIAQYIPTLTPSPSNTSTLTETLVASSTPMNFGTPTRIPPTNTRGPGQLPAPTRTRTPLPTASHTPIPNTNTPIPSPTDTIPPDTDTPIPPPTNTSPPDTDTPIPPDTATPLPIEQQVGYESRAIQKGSRSFR